MTKEDFGAPDGTVVQSAGRHDSISGVPGCRGVVTRRDKSAATLRDAARRGQCAMSWSLAQAVG